MRVLHLIDHNSGSRPNRTEAGGEAAMFACRSLITHLPQHEHTVCLIGGSSIPALAQAHGLDQALHLHAPLGKPSLSHFGLRRIIADRGIPDLVHCWSSGTLSLKALALPRIPCAATLLQRSNRAKSVELRVPALTYFTSRLRVHSLHKPPLVVLSEESKADWQETYPQAHSVRIAPLPGIESNRTVSKEQFRCDHRFERDELVLLLLGQSPSQADAMRFMFLMDMLHVSSAGIVGLISASAGQVARGLRFQARRRNTWRVLVSDRPMPDLLSVADIAVCEGDRFSAVSGAAAPNTATAIHIAAAHRMGVPVVAPEQVGSSELYNPIAQEACVAFNAALPELARKILPLHNNRALLAQVASDVTKAGESIDGMGFASMVDDAWNDAIAASSQVTAGRVTLPA